MTTFERDGKTVSVWPGRGPGAPLVYLNTFGEEGAQVRAEMDRLGCPDCSWRGQRPGLGQGPVPLAGAGHPPGRRTLCRRGRGLSPLDDRHPAARRPGGAAGEIPAGRGLAGYSMAGMFAVWALCQTDVFRRGASMSGSLWYPGVRDYLLGHLPQPAPDCFYFSLGSKESKTRNPALRTVEEDTRAVEAFYREKGSPTTFQLNPGNHFRDTAARTAAGHRLVVAGLKNRHSVTLKLQNKTDRMNKWESLL